MNDSLCPNDRHGASVVAGDEVIDVVSELLDVGEAGAGKGTGLQDGEPDLDLVEPGTVGWSEVKSNIGMACEPAFALELMGREIVEDDVDLLARIGGDGAVHEIEELDAPATLVMAGGDLAGEHVERGKQGRGSVAPPRRVRALYPPDARRTRGPRRKARRTQSRDDFDRLRTWLS